MWQFFTLQGRQYTTIKVAFSEEYPGCCDIPVCDAKFGPCRQRCGGHRSPKVQNFHKFAFLAVSGPARWIFRPIMSLPYPAFPVPPFPLFSFPSYILSPFIRFPFPYPLLSILLHPLSSMTFYSCLVSFPFLCLLPLLPFLPFHLSHPLPKFRICDIWSYCHTAGPAAIGLLLTVFMLILFCIFTDVCNTIVSGMSVWQSIKSEDDITTWDWRCLSQASSWQLPLEVKFLVSIALTVAFSS